MEEPIYVFAPVRRSKRSGMEWIDRYCIRESAEEALDALRQRFIYEEIIFTVNNPLVRVERFRLVV